MLSSLLSGFLTSASLILAIGSQNAFVLRQGIRGEHVFWVCLVCACSDALLVTAGVVGAGAVFDAVPAFESVMRLLGAAFLAVYAMLALRRAWAGGQAMTPGASAATSLREALLTCLALTWLNPHVYLDTVVLLGGLAARDASPPLFGLGAAAASFAFFFSLGFAARMLAPVFARPAAWRVLDGLVAVTMLVVAASLVWTA